MSKNIEVTLDGAIFRLIPEDRLPEFEKKGYKKAEAQSAKKKSDATSAPEEKKE